MTETRTTLKVSKTDPEISEEVTFTASVDEIVYDAALHTCIWKPLTTPAPTLTIYTYGMVLERDPITHRPIVRWKRIEVCNQQTNTGTIMCTKSWTSPSVTGPQTYHAEFAGDNTHAKSTSCGISPDRTQHYSDDAHVLYENNVSNRVSGMFRSTVPVEPTNRFLRRLEGARRQRDTW